MEVKKLWFENDKIYILTTEGKTLWQSLLWYPRLLHASDSQREKYSIDAMGNTLGRVGRGHFYRELRVRRPRTARRCPPVKSYRLPRVPNM